MTPAPINNLRVCDAKRQEKVILVAGENNTASTIAHLTNIFAEAT